MNLEARRELCFNGFNFVTKLHDTQPWKGIKLKIYN